MTSANDSLLGVEPSPIHGDGSVVAAAGAPVHAAVPVVDESEDLFTRLLADYTSEVQKLAAEKPLWTSRKPEEFKKNEKINILIFDGLTFMLHIFKQGCRSLATAKFGPGLEQDVWGFLSEKNVQWAEVESGKWGKDEANSDETTPGSTYVFNRELQITKDHKLVWKGRHTNPPEGGQAYRVDDTLHIEYV